MPCILCRANEDALRWVAEETWTFQRSFNLPKGLEQTRRLNWELVLDGIDTVAAIHLNGTHIADLQNAHRCSLSPAVLPCYVSEMSFRCGSGSQGSQSPPSILPYNAVSASSKDVTATRAQAVPL